MDLSRYSQKIEIAFWVSVIPLMKDSPLLGAFLRGVFWLHQKGKGSSGLPLYIAWAASGLALGFILGLLSVLLRSV